ncbi:MAG: ATP-binding protein [Candidatus Omnitrophica bacterium]|nr:ATP-binding protein [Candidatus Omnitrophota bacterium]
MVDKEIILKRINILEPIYKRLNSLVDGYRQNIALIGETGVGKSTILKYLLTSFMRPQLTFAYVNLNCSDFEQFSYKLLGSMLYNYLQEKGLIIKDDFDYLSKASEKILPNTSSQIEEIKQLIERHKYNEAFAKTFDCTDIFTKETGHRLVFIIDEFHLLEEMDIKNVFALFSKRIMLQQSVAFIVASSHVGKARKILSEKLSLLFGNFEVMNIHPLDHTTSKEFISSIIYPFGIADVGNDFLINLTGGFPLYLKLIANELSRLAEKNVFKQIDEHIIATALYNLLSKETGLLNEKFNNTVMKISELKSEHKRTSSVHSWKILISIANGFNKSSSLVKNLRKGKPQIQAKLTKLIDQNIISKNSSFFKINDPVFELWLKYVFSKKQYNFNEDELDFKNQFISEIKTLIENFTVESKRNFIDRISEVFEQFKDESIVFERRRWKLTKFNEIRPLSFAGSGIRSGIYGRGAGDLWIAALKQGHVCESDISEFIVECKKFKNKRLKKVLIALGEIDLNAALLAKEEKIQTWNLNHLNLLLRLFGKPKIIHY